MAERHRDGLTLLKKLLLAGLVVILIGVGVGIIVYYYFGPIPVFETLKPILTPIYTAWTSIPTPLKSLLTLGIPALLTIFFAWSKNRAMQKLQQTQQEATQRLGQLQGEKLELQSQVTGYEQTYGKTFTGEIKNLATELRDTQNALTAKTAEIGEWKDKQQQWFSMRSSLEDERNYLSRRVAELEAQLNAKPRVH